MLIFSDYIKIRSIGPNLHISKYIKLVKYRVKKIFEKQPIQVTNLTKLNKDVSVALTQQWPKMG